MGSLIQRPYYPPPEGVIQFSLPHLETIKRPFNMTIDGALLLGMSVKGLPGEHWD